TGRGGAVCTCRHSPAAARLHRTGRRGSIVGRDHRVSGVPALFFATKPRGRGMCGAMFLLEHDGDLARLTLNRPEARNAIPAAGWAELAAAVGRAGAGDARLLVVTGAGGTFCAGADLADFAATRGDEAAAARFREEMRTALDALRELAMPTLAVIEGHCYGAGVALAMACDLRIASLTARFAITPAKLGIGYPQEDVHRLVELLGPGQAARVLFTAEPIDGEEARTIGLVDDHMPREPDNRIECRPAGVASFARVCTLDSAPTARGNMLTIRKADGGFRRLIETNDGHFLAADGAQHAHAIPLQDRRTEVEIGGDRF